MFNKFAKAVEKQTGHPWSFFTALIIIIVWGALGPLFHFSDSWQLTINTFTTIITFLMVFVIQNTQHRDGIATQIKLNELLRALKGAHTELAEVEELSDEDLEKLENDYKERAHKISLLKQKRAENRKMKRRKTDLNSH